jgi:KDO2-lipid IV(A) lauroyltransferase
LNTALHALARFWAPRYWFTWVFLLWLRMTAALPWHVAIAVHKRLGALAGMILRRRRLIVQRNLEICFPDLDARQIATLTKRQFENIGAFLAEIAMSWFAAPEKRAHLFRVEGIEHVRAALARGKGVVLFSGHFTPLEICVPAIKALVPFFAYMFRERHNELLNEFQTRCRRRAAHVALANDDIRAMLRLLEQNAVVWYAPDQARIDSGELLPFFGEPAMTSTAPSRLARLSGAIVIPFLYCRLPDDDGYLLRFHAPLDGLPSNDAAKDTVRLIGVLEGFIRECPDQYLWTHRKFKDRPGNLPDAYV